MHLNKRIYLFKDESKENTQSKNVYEGNEKNPFEKKIWETSHKIQKDLILSILAISSSNSYHL